MASRATNIVARLDCDELGQEGLIEIAERVDNFVGAEPPPEGYGVAEAFSAILNGGTLEEMVEAFGMLKGWNFQPEGGWPHDRKEPNG